MHEQAARPARRRAITLIEAPPADDDWYANLLWLDRRKCLLLTHAGTLFPVFVADIQKRDLEPLGPYLVRVIQNALRQEILPLDALGPLDADSLCVARTTSRSILGFVTEMAFACRYQVEDAGGLDGIDIDVPRYRWREGVSAGSGET